MHRDEAIYARSDARGGITLTAEEAADLAVAAGVAADRLTEDGWAPRLRALAARLNAASTTPSP